MNAKDASKWITSHELVNLLIMHRDNDVKVNIRGNLVPIADVHYDANADTIVIELIEGTDLRMALDDDEPVDQVMEAFERAEKGVTSRPDGEGSG